jgi:7-cyano-7-deazaguanine synthase
MTRAVVLLSGGLDSSVNLLAAKAQGIEISMALSFDYGQRAAEKELAATKRMTSALQIPHQVLSLAFFKSFGGSSLTDSSKSIPTGSQVDINDLKTSQETAKSVWVPNRNGIFLNIAAGFAESLNADVVIPGFNREEAATFPDNSQEFLETTTRALKLSTSNKVQIQCLTTHLNKTEIVALGAKLQMNWSWIWPCYFSGDNWCGQCESCLRSYRAFQQNGIDVSQYLSKKSQ